MHQNSKLGVVVSMLFVASLIFYAKKIRIEFPGCLQVCQVLWFGGGATCTLMCMLCVLVVVK